MCQRHFAVIVTPNQMLSEATTPLDQQEYAACRGLPRWSGLQQRTLPRDRGQARWAHSSFTHAAAPFSSRKSTHGSPNSSNGMSLSSVSFCTEKRSDQSVSATDRWSMCTRTNQHCAASEGTELLTFSDTIHAVLLDAYVATVCVSRRQVGMCGKGKTGERRTLVKCAGYQWLRRPGSNRRLLVRWRDLGRRGTTLPLPLRCCGSSCRSVDEAPPRPLSRTGGGAVATAVAEEEVAAEAAMEARPPIMPDARPAAKAGDAASAASVAAFMRSSWACHITTHNKQIERT